MSISVGISGDQLLGPVIFPYRPTGALHHRFWLNDVPVILECVHVQKRQHTWFTCDAAATHFPRITKYDGNSISKLQIQVATYVFLIMRGKLSPLDSSTI
jgi:hypothetical protein